MNYSFDKSKFIQQLLPTFLRTTLRETWLGVLLKPLFDIHSDFLTKVDEIRDEIALNGQKLTLEWYLNNLFDNTNRQIYITYADEENPSPAVYLISENQDGLDTYLISETPQGDGTVNLYLISETEGDADFIVHYPDNIGVDLDALNRAINKIKKAAKRHELQSFTP